MSKLGDILKEGREASGLSQEDVAKAIGKGLRTYQYYEEGTVTPKMPTLTELSKILKFPLSDVFTDEKKLRSNSNRKNDIEKELLKKRVEDLEKIVSLLEKEKKDERRKHA